MKDGTAVLSRLSAFTNSPSGGNPAGVWIGPSLPGPEEMLRVAAEVGYSETAFLAGGEDRVFETRYYSPEAEVSFCGHATIASGVKLGMELGSGTYCLQTAVGEVPVEVTETTKGFQAALTSVETRHKTPSVHLLQEALGALDWKTEELDSAIGPAVAYAGAWHLILAAENRDRLDNLDYDSGRLRRIMLENDLTTLQLVWRESPSLFHCRNPFPVGGVVEDPATGAAAAALGGYLRDAEMVETPLEFTILQGEIMGRPSRIGVSVPTKGGVTVFGTAVVID